MYAIYAHIDPQDRPNVGIYGSPISRVVSRPSSVIQRRPTARRLPGFCPMHQGD